MGRSGRSGLRFRQRSAFARPGPLVEPRLCPSAVSRASLRRHPGFAAGVEQTGRSRERMIDLASIAYFRVPADFPIMGDCSRASSATSIRNPALPDRRNSGLLYASGLRFRRLHRSPDRCLDQSSEAFALPCRRRRFSSRAPRTPAPLGADGLAVQGWDAAATPPPRRKYVQMGYVISVWVARAEPTTRDLGDRRGCWRGHSGGNADPSLRFGPPRCSE